jgi:hypothetical protein
MKKYKDRTIVGLIEPITIKGNNGKTKTVLARIDSGATKSSIDKKLVEELELGPIIRERLTKQVHGFTLRPVIKPEIVIKNRTFNYQFTIADRGKMKYSVLIGQNILKKNFLIDPMIKTKKVEDNE